MMCEVMLKNDPSYFVPERSRCPLHKHIRKHVWQLVLSTMQHDPSQICQQNSVGWSSLILAIYHSAPFEIIAAMFTLTSCKERTSLLSTPVPNGLRLCLHFATRYSSDLDVIQLVTECYPHALLVKSNDGVTPLDRAIYYRKDALIVSWLDTKTTAQKTIYEIDRYNEKLRDEVVNCCESRWSEIASNEYPSSGNNGDFIAQVYGFSKERAMIALFVDILSYVGIHSIPS